MSFDAQNVIPLGFTLNILYADYQYFTYIKIFFVNRIVNRFFRIPKDPNYFLGNRT